MVEYNKYVLQIDYNHSVYNIDNRHGLCQDHPHSCSYISSMSFQYEDLLREQDNHHSHSHLILPSDILYRQHAIYQSQQQL